MDERDFPAPPSAGEQLGAMTGATGRLTPDDPDDDFVPAETREVSDPETSRDLTAAAHRRREVRRSHGDDQPGSLTERGENTRPNDRDGGYGSEHGLAADDPAYREEEHLPPADPVRPVRETRLGGDELGTTESDRF